MLFFLRLSSALPSMVWFLGANVLSFPCFYKYLVFHLCLRLFQTLVVLRFDMLCVDFATSHRLRVAARKLTQGLSVILLQLLGKTVKERIKMKVKISTYAGGSDPYISRKPVRFVRSVIFFEAVLRYRTARESRELRGRGV